MELETNTPINNDARLLAQAKKLTLEPVHANVEPEDTPDSIIVANHLRNSAIANASNDVEQDAPLIAPADTHSAIEPQNPTKLYLLTATGIIALAVIILIVVLGN